MKTPDILTVSRCFAKFAIAYLALIEKFVRVLRIKAATCGFFAFRAAYIQTKNQQVTGKSQNPFNEFNPVHVELSLC